MRLYATFLLLSLAACASRGARASPPAVAAFDPADGVVLPESVAPGIMHQCSRSARESARGYWTPQPGEIAAFERALAPVLQAALDSADRRRTLRAADYLRQYAGAVMPDGRRIICANGFHRSGKEGTDWRSEPLMILDGGRSVFGVEYDMATGEVRGLRFNGEA